MQTLDVCATSLMSARPRHSSNIRLRKGTKTIAVRLSTLTIRLDLDADHYPDAREWEKFNGFSDGYIPEMITFEPLPMLLSALNPTRLEIRMAEASSGLDRDRQGKISEAAASAIAGWSRLRTIVLVDVNLSVGGGFFLGPSIVDPLGGKGSNSWSIVWDLTEAEPEWFEPEEGGLWLRLWGESLVSQLVGRRPGVLTMRRVKEATILVGNEEVGKTIEEEIKAVSVAMRGPLKLVIQPKQDT